MGIPVHVDSGTRGSRSLATIMGAAQVVIMADGQVTRGNEIVKPNVKKVRRLNENVIGGFAGQKAMT